MSSRVEPSHPIKPEKQQSQAGAEPKQVVSPKTWRQRLPIVCLVAWCLFIVILRSAPRHTVLESESSQADYLIPVCGAWALESGLHIHSQFSTPLGLAFYLPYYWSLKLFGNSHAIVRYAESEIFVVVSIMAFLLLKPPRYSWRITALGVALIGLLATSPVYFGDSPFVTYEGIAYNRLAIALGYLCLLGTLFRQPGPAGKKDRAELVHALVLGASLVWVAFVKLNYLAVNGAFIALGAILSWYTLAAKPQRFYASLIGFTALIALAFIICFRVDVGGMLRDLHMAGEARRSYIMTLAPETGANNIPNWGLSALYVRAIKVLSQHQTELSLLLVTLAGGLGALTALTGAPLKNLAVYGGLLLLVLAADLFLNMFSGYGLALPMIPFMWLFLLCAVERPLAAGPNAAGMETARTVRRLVGIVVSGALICYIAHLGLGYVAEFVQNSKTLDGLATYGASPRFDPNDTIQAPGWDGLFITAVNMDGDKPGISFAGKINQGLELLRTNNLASSKIAVLDQINPFPVMLHAPFPEGQPVWIHPGGTFDQRNYWPVDTFLAGTDVILVPKKPINGWGTGLMAGIYGSYVQAHFAYVAQNDSWQLFRRKPGE